MKWSQSKLAHHLGYTRDLVGKWERGENIPTLETLLAMARVFGVTLDDLVDPSRLW